MPLHVQHRETCVGVVVVARWQQHVGTDVHVAAPELGELLATNLHVPDPFRVLEVAELQHFALAQRTWRLNDVVEYEVDGRRAIVTNGNRLYVTVGIARCLERVLEGAAVHVSFDHMTVSALEGRVHVQKRLHVIVARRQRIEAIERVTAHRVCTVDDEGDVACLVIADIDAPERIARHPGAKVRHLFVIARDDKKRAANDRNFEAQCRNTFGSGLTERDSHFSVRLLCGRLAAHTQEDCGCACRECC